MRYLLVPGNNSLSHIAKCLAVEHELAARGHEVLIAASRKSSQFLKRTGMRHAVLPDIQESDDAGLPTVEWFRDPRGIGECVEAEIDLIRQFKPDRVLGVFRFTLKASAHAAGVPYDSLICGCMMPDSKEVLGFSDSEPGSSAQRIVLDGFYRYAAARASSAFEWFGAGPIADIRDLLVGEHTFLWDFPEFALRGPRPGVLHIGPITWNRWPYDPLDISSLAGQGSPLAVVAFGTCHSQASVIKRIVGILLELGYRVLVAAGGQQTVADGIPRNGRVTVCSFAPLHEIFPHTSLLVTHGGQMTVFEALQHGVPVLVMPFQPEQAHNGVCLERSGCGSRLIPSRCFQGNSSAYVGAFDQQTDSDITSIITGVVDNPETATRLAAMQEAMGKYPGTEALAERMEVS